LDLHIKSALSSFSTAVVNYENIKNEYEILKQCQKSDQKISEVERKNNDAWKALYTIYKNEKEKIDNAVREYEKHLTNYEESSGLGDDFQALDGDSIEKNRIFSDLLKKLELIYQGSEPKVHMITGFSPDEDCIFYDIISKGRCTEDHAKRVIEIYQTFLNENYPGYSESDRITTLNDILEKGVGMCIRNMRVREFPLSESIQEISQGIAGAIHEAGLTGINIIRPFVKGGTFP